MNNKEKNNVTNEDYRKLREELIKDGVISFEFTKPIKPYSKEFTKKLRKNLIDGGFIFPIEREDGRLTFCDSPVHIDGDVCEEGEYKAKKITSNVEYNRRKQSYFRILQEVLYYRKKLNLVFGNKNVDDSDCYF